MTRKTRCCWMPAAPFVVLSTMLLFLLLFLAACATSASPTPEILEKSTPPMTVRLSTASRPALGAVLDLLCEFTPERDVSNLGITLTLPAQLEIISGQTTWHGNAAANETVSLPLQVRVVEEGRFDARAYAYVGTNRSGYGAGAKLYFLVHGARGWAGNAPLVNHWVGNRIAPGGMMVDAASNPVRARAYLTEPLAWGGQTEAVLEVTSAVTVENARIGFIVPTAGLQVMDRQISPTSALAADTRGASSGNAERRNDIFWEGTVSAGETVVARIKLRPTTTGEGVVHAYMSDVRPQEGPVLLYSESLQLQAFDPDRAE